MELIAELDAELAWWEASGYSMCDPEDIPEIWQPVARQHPVLAVLLFRIEGGPTGLCMRAPDDDYVPDQPSLADGLRNFRDRVTGAAPPNWVNGDGVGLPGLWYIFLYAPA